MALDPCRVVRDAGELASRVDNTLLKPVATLADAGEWLSRSLGRGFRCHMLPPYHAARLVGEAGGERVCSVACFPYPFYDLGHCLGVVEALGVAGVWEVDVVAPLHLVRTGVGDEVEAWLGGVVDLAGEYGMGVKVIVEAPVLGEEELELAVRAVASSGAGFVKTSTGVIAKGGDPYTVARVYRVARRYGLPVKAAGGIRDVYGAAAAVAAGAEVLGTSSGLAILEGYESWCREK